MDALTLHRQKQKSNSCQDKKEINNKKVKQKKYKNNENKNHINGCNDDDSPLSLSNAFYRST